MARTKPAAPNNARNGLKWRDGRPRWEPSPANRKAAIGGLDLKDLAGAWLDRGAAIDAADARTLWASMLRQARAGDARATANLKTAVARLQPPEGDAQRLRRRHLADLIEAGHQLLDLGPPVLLEPGVRTVADLVDGYFKAPPLKPDPRGGPARPPASETLRAYKVQSGKLKARFGTRPAEGVTRGELRAWYLELAETSLNTANMTLAATSAFYRWGTWQTPPWVSENPATRLGMTKPAGRLVFWELAEERDFTAWCDANGFADVADAVVLMAWTGASPIDACKATLADLAGESWRYVRHKTQRRGLEALPGLLQPVKDRVARRKALNVRGLRDGFLVDPQTWTPHTPDTLGRRFAEARAAAVTAGALSPAFADKQMRDLRDTCISRLAWSGVPLDRIPPWSGHSRKDAEHILRAHYLNLREREALDDAALLDAWAAKEGLALV